MKTLRQTLLIGVLSLAAAGATYLVKGPPDRTVEVSCDPAALKPGELCLEQVVAGGSGNLVWIDARSRREWERDGYPGSLLWNLDGSEDANAFAATVAAYLFEKLSNSAETPRVIVYCGNADCGVSHQVAEQIRALQLGVEVNVLRGGWQALAAAGMVKGPSGGI
jgi:rhodanese-related sulfurtransferase